MTRPGIHPAPIADRPGVIPLRGGPPTLEPGLLRSFVLVCDLGTVTAAAERQGLTQAAVSMQMRRLEVLLGRELLVMEGRRMSATEDGLTLLDYAQKILDLNDQVIAQLTGVTLAGEVRLGLVEDAAAYGLARILRDFHVAHPKVRLQLKVNQSHLLLPLLDAGKLDLVLAKFAADGREGEPLMTDQLVWVAEAGYRLAEAGELRVICSPPPCVNRLVMTTALARARRPFSIVCSSPTQAGIHVAVLAGLGVAVMPEQTLVPGMRVLTDAFLPKLPKRSISLFRSERRPAPAVRQFIARLQREFGLAAADPDQITTP